MRMNFILERKGAVSKVGNDYSDKVVWRIKSGECVKEKRPPHIVKCPADVKWND